MAFNTALSGLRAANQDLSVTGNNIANASTVGFKRSRVEFGDVYANAVLGSGRNAVGSGVLVQDVAQQFQQGNISFTDNSLDLAINGSGFFVTQDANQGRLYTRAGTFGLDNQGHIVANNGAQLLGFAADDSGNIRTGAAFSPLEVTASNLLGQQTTDVSLEFSLDARDVAPEVRRRTVTLASPGPVLGSSNGRAASSIEVNGRIYDFDANATARSIATALDGVNGATASAVTVSDFRFDSVINLSPDQYLSLGPGVRIPLPGEANITTPNQLVNAINQYPNYTATYDSDTATFTVINSRGDDIVLDVSSGGNAVPAGGSAIAITVEPDSTAPLTLAQGSAQESATQFGQITLVQDDSVDMQSQSQTSLRVESAINLSPAQPLVLGSGDSQISVPSVSFGNISTIGELVDAINEYPDYEAVSSTDSLGNTVISIVNSTGDDFIVDLSGAPAGFQVTVNPDETGQTILTSGGATQSVLAGVSVFNQDALDAADQLAVTTNQFEPSDPETYNAATSMTIYDSQGTPHVMTLYFVKDLPELGTSGNNNWTMYVQVDGQEVGGTDPNNPTRLSFPVQFNADGTLDTSNTNLDSFYVSNWTPSSSTQQNLPLGPNPDARPPFTQPAASSNFMIDITGSTQVGTNFAIGPIDQDGYAPGELTGLDVTEEGILFARYTNGESRVLGQLALADFTNVQGLSPVGDTMWAESFESGQPSINAPGSGALGVVQSGALEESNVDLSEQLVNLIIAQRNFQANAKTIETANAVTQSIINLR